MTADRGVELHGAAGPEVDALVEELAGSDLLGELLEGRGRAAELSLEGGERKLGWVAGVERALARPDWLAAAEREAAEIVAQGIEHVIWAGMGGSVQTLHVLARMGYLDTGPMTVHPCDSTDPAALSRILAAIAGRLDVPLEAAVAAGDDAGRLECLRRILGKTMMIGVSMGMTSEEPITHLEWFDGLLAEAGIADAKDHIQVMTLPGSYLDRFARSRGARMYPIQLDGENSTPGRMSAPATRVFVRPVALVLVAGALARGERHADGALLARVLGRAQALYGVDSNAPSAERARRVREDPFVRLGALVSNEVRRRGRNKLLVVAPEPWQASVAWIEQVAEESLGKGGRGFLVFGAIEPPAARVCGEDVIVLVLAAEGAPRTEPGALGALRAAGVPVLELAVPVDALEGVPTGLGEVAALFSCFKLTVVAFACLEGIVFAGQPAVEAYKKYARDLREADAPLLPPAGEPHQATFRSLTLHYGSLVANGLVDAAALDAAGDAVAAYAAILDAARHSFRFRYMDFTFNGEPTPAVAAVLARAREDLAEGALGMPCKLREGPSDYHSTEQSETDGPFELVSTRLVALEHEAVTCGAYDDRFLLAQARGTWQAMEDAGRWVVMLSFPRLDAPTLTDLAAFFDGAAGRLADR